MPTILCFNPGSNSLKFDIIDVPDHPSRAGDGRRLLAGVIDDIEKQTSVEVMRGGETILSKEIETKGFGPAAAAVLAILQQAGSEEMSKVKRIAVRVVHGGDRFTRAVRFDEGVRREIMAREELAPLHNASSLEIIDAVCDHSSSLPIAVAFDTSFHSTLPEKSWRYPIDRATADRHGIRKFGFHGLSHRYMLEQYAYLAGKNKEDLNVITMHLESGSSITAIRGGRSVETSMGLTPLEGLMMGTRSGSVDPAILPFLMKKENFSSEEALELLEKKSGLLGVSGVSVDTRILRKRSDPNSKLAMEMFAYRVLQMTGAYLAVLGDAEAILFGGGIGENTPEVRTTVCDGIKGWGVVLDGRLNESTLQGDKCVSNPASKLAVWAMHSDEAMQLAYECSQVALSGGPDAATL